MPGKEETFWSEYRALVSRLMPFLKKSDGAAEKDVVAAEQRLGLRLPRLLREFYLLTDERDDINETHNRLYPLEALTVEGDTLIFYEENQGVCVWGVTLGTDDPAIVRKDDGINRDWEPDFDHLSQFLIAMLFMQAVNGGMRYCGVGAAGSAALSEAGSEWAVYNTGGRWENRVLMRDGQVLYIFGDEPNPDVFGGAKTKKQFLALEKAFNVSWDYCSLDDE